MGYNEGKTKIQAQRCNTGFAFELKCYRFVAHVVSGVCAYLDVSVSFFLLVFLLLLLSCFQTQL